MKRVKYLRKIEKVHKPLLAVVVVLTLIAAMMGGTVAWRDFSQSKTNKFRGFTEAEVTLHDEFDGEDKDVFVENAGTSTVYVRIRLDEYMEIGGESLVQTAKVKDKSSWTPHTYYDAAAEDYKQTEVCHEFHGYYTWNMSGARRNYLEGTPGLVYTKLDENEKVNPNPPAGLPTAVAAVPITMTEYFTLLEKANNSVGMSAEELEKWTAATTTGCWILDDTLNLVYDDALDWFFIDTLSGNGWAYWSMPLAPGTATNLLLDSVTRTNKEPGDDWYYGIDVKLQAVTENDFSRWSVNGWTVSSKASQLIEIWKAVQ